MGKEKKNTRERLKTKRERTNRSAASSRTGCDPPGLEKSDFVPPRLSPSSPSIGRPIGRGRCRPVEPPSQPTQPPPPDGSNNEHAGWPLNASLCLSRELSVTRAACEDYARSLSSSVFLSSPSCHARENLALDLSPPPAPFFYFRGRHRVAQVAWFAQECAMSGTDKPRKPSPYKQRAGGVVSSTPPP